jgi:hypothetical protein
MAGSSWWIDSQPGPSVPGGTTYGGGGSLGGTAGVIQYRSPLDARRAASGQLPQAEYPDGYLGTIVDRHEDKLLRAVQEKLTERSYQRGVHKGAKIDASDYFWDGKAVTPDAGLRRESRTARKTDYTISVKRFAPVGNPVERLAHIGKTTGLTPPEQMAMAKQYGVSVARNPVVLQDPDRKARMMRMLPNYARTM